PPREVRLARSPEAEGGRLRPATPARTVVEELLGRPLDELLEQEAVIRVIYSARPASGRGKGVSFWVEFDGRVLGGGNFWDGFEFWLPASRGKHLLRLYPNTFHGDLSREGFVLQRLTKGSALDEVFCLDVREPGVYDLQLGF